MQTNTTPESVINVPQRQPTEYDDRDSFETDKVIQDNLTRETRGVAGASIHFNGHLISHSTTSPKETASFAPDSLNGIRGASDDTLSNLQEGVDRMHSMTYRQAI